MYLNILCRRSSVTKTALHKAVGAGRLQPVTPCTVLPKSPPQIPSPPGREGCPSIPSCRLLMLFVLAVEYHTAHHRRSLSLGEQNTSALCAKRCVVEPEAEMATAFWGSLSLPQPLLTAPCGSWSRERRVEFVFPLWRFGINVVEARSDFVLLTFSSQISGQGWGLLAGLHPALAALHLVALLPRATACAVGVCTWAELRGASVFPLH